MVQEFVSLFSGFKINKNCCGEIGFIANIFGVHGTLFKYYKKMKGKNKMGQTLNSGQFANLMKGVANKAYNRRVVDTTKKHQKEYGFEMGSGEHAMWNNEADAFKHV